MVAMKRELEMPWDIVVLTLGPKKITSVFDSILISTKKHPLFAQPKMDSASQAVQ